MAVTKTHPIKSTLKAAIDYICNPEKTDGKLLVSSYGCAAETADIEFAWTRRHAIDKGTHLGRHLIQAFQPGEVTPEQAHEIGMELAREILGGKYEFVLTTHIDRDHVHNHLIFNAVSFADHKQKKKQERSQRIHRRSRSRFCYGKVLKTATFLSQNSREKTGWEIIRAWPENATTGGYFAFFPPLFPLFFKR